MISSFNSIELRKISLFMKSSVIKVPNETNKLFLYLKSCINKKKLPSEVEAFSFCYKDSKYNNDKLRILNSHCLKAIEKYLLLSHLDKPESQNQKSLILQKYYRENRLDKLFKAESNQFKKCADLNLINNYEHIEEVFQGEFENYHYDSMEGRKQELNLQTLIDLSDVLHFARKIKLACFATAHDAVYKKGYKIRDLEQTLDTIKKEKLYEHPSIGAYYYGYKIMSNPSDTKILLYYIDYIKKVQHQFPKEESRTLYYMAINTCIKNLNKGNKNYGNIGLALYESALASKVILVDGRLSRFTYRNIAMMAIRSNRFEWAENFSHEYAPFLRKQDRKSAYHFNLALIAFHNNNFGEAHIHIQDADFKDHLIHLAAKSLQSKIYFELGAFDAMGSVLDTMEIYIRRNKVLGYHKESYKNTIKFFRKMISIPKSEFLKLRQELESEKVLLERTWLMEKLK